MATTIDTSSNPLAAYGYDAQTAQQLADSLGMTVDQVAGAFAQTPTAGGRDLDATIASLRMAKAAGLGGQAAAAVPAAPATSAAQPAASAPIDNTPSGAQTGGYYYGNTSGTSPTLSGNQGPGMATTGTQDAFGISQVGSGNGYAILANNQGQQIAVDPNGNYFSIDANGNHTPISDQQAVSMGFQSANPETNALKQMGQIDPSTEALRQQLSSSYQDPNTAANPTAAQYQSYLDTFKQVDPTEYAERQGLAGSMDSYLKSVQDQYNLGSQLDPVTQMQVEQQARKAQADRGNLYGSGQAAVEAMTTGQAGQALQLQRQQALQGALQGQQSYLGAGLGLGDTAMSLYQQGLANKANSQQNALSYLSSGQTPYQAGASYLSNAEGTAANAAQGGPVYNPASLGTSYSGSAQSAPQYGLDLGAQSQNYFNSLNNAYGGGTGANTKNRMVGAASGAVSGAIAGAPLAATTYGGSVVGGAIAGGLGGYYS